MALRSLYDLWSVHQLHWDHEVKKRDATIYEAETFSQNHRKMSRLLEGADNFVAILVPSVAAHLALLACIGCLQ